MSRAKSVVLAIPLLGSGLRWTWRGIRRFRFGGSSQYWEQRYATEGDSGAGSYGRLAEFKARVVNEVVSREQVESVVELGCGDGNQLTMLRVPRYLGLDVSRSAVKRCAERFDSDPLKSFAAYDPDAFHDRAGFFRADLALSMDVLYHLVEDEVYERYLAHLFGSAERCVLIYSSDVDQPTPVVHVRHRNFTRDVSAAFPSWDLVEKLKNDYAEPDEDGEWSVSDFYLYRRRTSPEG
ncbi:MAG TPA: class I SAM-dependent methyltransferase [Acidimicrobiales bacterium]|nr:class I SAM-dependent methyltransferase [Acidimicrobiales bacterium]